MILLRYLALVPAKYFIWAGLAGIAVFDLAKLLFQPDDLISGRICEWSLNSAWLKYLIAATAGGLVVHWCGL
jgi:hypothetical protein